MTNVQQPKVQYWYGLCEDRSGDLTRVIPEVVWLRLDGKDKLTQGQLVLQSFIGNGKVIGFGHLLDESAGPTIACGPIDGIFEWTKVQVQTAFKELGIPIEELGRWISIDFQS